MPRGSRPRVKGFEASPNQCLRTAISYQRKHIINSFVEQNGMAAAVTRFYPSLQAEARKRKKRQLPKWFEARDDIAKQVAQGNGYLCKEPRPGVGCILPRAEEDYLAFWVRDLRREGIPVSPLMLQMKARAAANELGLRSDQFSASSFWRRRFLKSYRLSLRRRTRIGQKTPSDSREVAEQFRKKVQKMMLKHGITEVYNADQTALNFEHLPTHTIDETGTRTVWVRNSGKEKSRLTAMVLADSRGIKRAPFLVFKQPPSRVPATEQHNHKEQQGYTSVCQPADIAWMRPLKVQLRAEWLSDIEKQFERHQGKQSKFVLAAPTREVVVGWLHASWTRLSKSTIVAGFRKLGVPSDQREVPLENVVAYDSKLQVVIQLLENWKVGEDVSKDAERDNSN